MCHSLPLFKLFRLFCEQLTVNNCIINVAGDWIRTRVLWYRKNRPANCATNHFDIFQDDSRRHLDILLRIWNATTRQDSQSEARTGQITLLLFVLIKFRPVFHCAILGLYFFIFSSAVSAFVTLKFANIWNWLTEPCGRSYKHFTIIIYDSTVLTWARL